VIVKLNSFANFT